MKIIKVFVVVLFLLVLSSCSRKTKESIGQTDQYSEREIQSAMTTVENQYKEYVPGVFGGKLSSLTFDEKESDGVLKSFQGVLDSKEDAEKIAFSSEIRTGISAGTLSDFTTYSYYWILEKKEEWEIVYGGFLN